MRIPVLTALGGASWEADVIAGLEATGEVSVVRRCVDVVELLAMAAAGQPAPRSSRPSCAAWT